LVHATTKTGRISQQNPPGVNEESRLAEMYKNLSMKSLGHSVPFDETCALAQQHGFAGVDVDLQFLGSLGSDDAGAAWFSTTGLKPSAFSLRAAWRETDSESAFEESLAVVEADAKLAKALGTNRCVTRVEPRSEKLDFYQHFDLVVPRLIRVAEILAANTVMLGFEFVGPATLRTAGHKDFVHTLDGARTFAASIGMHTLNTGVLLDSFHWHTSGGSVNEIEHLDHHEVVSVHLNDAVLNRTVDQQLEPERELIGATGIVNLSGFLTALRTIGYLGPLTIAPANEALRSMSPTDAAAAASTALDRILV
jgi:sugar phosphate isomerase/epimerase